MTLHLPSADSGNPSNQRHRLKTARGRFRRRGCLNNFPRRQVEVCRVRRAARLVKVSLIGCDAIKARMRPATIAADQCARLRRAVIGLRPCRPCSLRRRCWRAGSVTREPWSVLKISGLPCLAKASCNVSTRNAASSVIETRHDSARRRRPNSLKQSAMRCRAGSV